MDADRGPDREPLDVVVCGQLFFDVVLTGLPGGPVPGTEVWATGVGSGPGGIATFAMALSGFGLRTGLVAAFGADPHGDLCRAILAGRGVDLSGAPRFEGWSTPVTVALAYSGDRAFATYAPAPPVPLSTLAVAMAPSRAVVVHLEPEPAPWLARAKADGRLVFADVGWDPSQSWPAALVEQVRGCHAFLPNEAEAMGYTRAGSAAEAVRRIADVVPLAVVTCGARGAVAIDAGTGEMVTVEGIPVDQVDPTGAGDVFGSALVAGTLAGWPLRERVEVANLSAALSVTRAGGGVAAPGWPELARWHRDLPRTAPDLVARFAFLPDLLPTAPTGA